MSIMHTEPKVSQTGSKTKESGKGPKTPFQPSALDLRRLEKGKAAIRKVLQRGTESTFEVGQLLVAAKADLDHGFFLDWIDRELVFGRRMGQLYMRIYSVLGVHGEKLAGFGIKTLGALAAQAVSEEHRETVVSEMSLGELASDEAVLERLRHLVSPDRAEKANQLKAERAVARKEVALLTYELAGERVEEVIDLLRAAGLTELANTLEEVVTEPHDRSVSSLAVFNTPSPQDPGGDADALDQHAIETADDPLPDFLA
jgi:hypothetical protein